MEVLDDFSASILRFSLLNGAYEYGPEAALRNRTLTDNGDRIGDGKA
jgi:hypothetical protein